jgi:RHS repeat-associated protein
MRERGWSKTLKRALGRRRPPQKHQARRPGRSFSPSAPVLLVVSLSLLALIVGAAMWFGPNVARGDEGGAWAGLGPEAPEAPEGSLPSAQETKELIESGQALSFSDQPDPGLHAAQTMPHRELEAGEALELAEAVFEPELESAGGIYAELEPEKYLSDYAAVVPASSLPEVPGSSGESLAAEHPDAGVVVESTMPLRTEAASGKEEAVDLSLEHSEGELQPRNPLTEVGIPGQLGEGISLAGPEVAITLAGAPASSTPTDVEGEFAFYPEVAEDTDLIVEPTARGVETMTDVRSAEAPRASTYQLSLPPEAKLEPSPHGGAEVVERGRATLVIPPATATDAAGEPVPVDMTVEGDQLTVTISPEPSTAFPVLVDPWYITETSCWTSCGKVPTGWSGVSSNPSYGPLEYAQWDPSKYPGLDLTSGFPGPAYSGTHADWAYWVPRYSQDIARGYGAPTSWVAYMKAEGVLFLPFGNFANWPAMLIGLVEPAIGWAPEARVHYGGEGELSNWGSIEAFNGPQNPAVKGADFNLVTYENEAQAKYRDAFMAGATIYLADADAPRILELKAPTGWITGSSASIGYRLEDTGLGVHGASIRLRGEAEPHPWWGANFGCIGTAVSPCPRVVGSAEAGAPALGFNPVELPTGKDELEVTTADPLEGEGHEATSRVTVDVDDKAPEIELSGPLTEQESLGTLKSEYPLTIAAVDGISGDPQSGVVSVEVKVDGKKKTMANETPWHPACKTENCRFSGSWTLKASEYAVGPHEVEVVATDAVGNVRVSTLEVEVGQGSPQTSFTSPHPTYENHEIPNIAFKATREGKPVEGATFKCGLFGSTETPLTSCTSPYELPEHLEPGWHVFVAQAVDKSGKADPTPARWRFETGDYPKAPPSEKLVYPEVGKKTASYYTLEAEWGGNPEGKASEGVTGVSFEMQLPGKVKNERGEEVPRSYEPVPTGCTIDGQGRQVSWPLPAHSHPGHSAPVYLKVRGCPAFEAAGYPEKEIQFRALFDGGEKVAGASEPVNTEFIYRYNANRVPTDATESIGPATVDLLTGAFTMNRTDVSIPVPGYEANLEFTRVYSSTVDKSLPGYSKVLGGAWQPSTPLESEYEGEAWSRIEEVVIPEQKAEYGEECWNEEGETVGCSGPCPPGSEFCERWLEVPYEPEEKWIELVDNEGAGIPFEISAAGYVAPEYARELSLRKEGGNIVLAYPNGTHTIFVPQAGTRDWLPEFISYQANAQSMRVEYKTEPGGKSQRLVREIAPAPAVDGCEYEPTVKKGCRTLIFEYAPLQYGEELGAIKYYGPEGASVKVAEYNYAPVKTATGYEEMLIAERDPRLPELVEWYAYDESPGYTNLITSLDPPGQEPWWFGYELGTSGKPSKLDVVNRAGASTTLAYNVPLTGSGAPYDMSATSIARWGQTDLPVDATAIFPPNHVPSKYPPTEYTGATIDYMDPEGNEVNSASPSPPGVSGASITTTETDVHGNVVRELSPRARLLALEAANPAARSHELDTHSVYNAAGTEMLESWGPLHQVRLETGESEPAREHTVTRYDEGEIPTPRTPPAYLPTKETVAAVVAGKEAELEPRVTEIRYNWGLRLPEETIVDPGGLAIRTVTHYNAAGQVEESRQPKGAGGGTAGDTRTIYYSATGTGECEGSPVYANLPCKVMPVKQESGGAARPELLVKKFLSYERLGQPTVVVESPGVGTAETRTTTIRYDVAGRQMWTKVEGGGVEVPESETTYNITSPFPTGQRFVCEQKECTGFDNQEVKTTYNKLGQLTEYTDADGAVTKMTYDALGRPATVIDPRGTETMHYDEMSGVLTSMEVSGVGTFTAAYDADGDLIRRGLPNGLTANTTYNVTDEPTKLTYTKTSSCGPTGCTWYEEALERSIEGQILADSGTVVDNLYRYDKAGRLTEAQETPTSGPTSGVCTSRHYTFDADSNRLTKVTPEPGVKGAACSTSGGTTQKYEYDNADRLVGPTYDSFGRITSLPAEFAGGKASEKPLETRYFANNMVAKQTQNGVSNTFQLDSTGRQRQREQVGGVAGVEVFHSDGPGDSPSWTALGSTWSRNVAGIGGELAAVQESNGTTTFKITDLHGDVVASASSSPIATALLAEYRFDEFGDPEGSGSAGRFGWLGGKSRRTELQSGVIQMGARSYIPQLGRFLTPDPEPGGSANAYDYSNQDPVNSGDPSGRKPYNRHKNAFMKGGIHIWSPKNHNPKSRGTMKARLFIRMGCGGDNCSGAHSSLHSEPRIRSATVGFEEGVGSGHIIAEVSLHGPNLNGSMPWAWENWNKGPALNFGCTPGEEYKVTVSVQVSTGFGRLESESMSASEYCGHGRY